MISNPMYSVIVIAYNRNNYIKRCLDSILEQKFRDFELIVIDDGSKDATDVIIKQYVNIDNRIKIVLHKKNLGILQSRIDGINLAQGKYILWVDSDDFVDKYWLKNIDEIVIKYSPEIVITGYYIENGNDSIEHIEPYNVGLYTDKCLDELKSNVIAPIRSKHNISQYLWSKAVLRSLCINILDSKSLNISQGEDILLFSVACLRASSVYITDNCNYHYRLHIGQTINKYFANYLQEMEQISSALKSFAKEYNFCNLFSFDIQMTYFELYYLVNSIIIQGDNPSFFSRRKIIKLICTQICFNQEKYDKCQDLLPSNFAYIYSQARKKRSFYLFVFVSIAGIISFFKRRVQLKSL